MSEQELNKDYFKERLKAVSCSLFIGIALMTIKFYAYLLTGSSAILSDALESIINIAASSFALVSILVAAKPPDKNHPYGHGKIEYFSAGFEGALIILAALGIFHFGWDHIFQPRQLPQLQEGLLLLVFATLVNLLLGMGLIRVGKKTDSLTLIADGKHIMTDVYTSGGVLAGLFLVHLTGRYWLDGTIACLVGLNILVSGAYLVRQSFAGLMNESDPGLLKEISALLSEHRKDIWIDIHQLRAWRSGNLVHIDFHLILSRHVTLEYAHYEGKELEILINKYFNGNSGVLIHLDPCIDPDCPICRQFCELRKNELKKEIPWSIETLTSHGGAGERLQRDELKTGESGIVSRD